MTIFLTDLPGRLYVNVILLGKSFQQKKVSGSGYIFKIRFKPIDS